MGCESGFRQDEITHKFVGLTLPYHFRGHHAILRKYEADRNVAYFTYVMNFPCKCKGSIYTTNWIEELNKKYKKTIKKGVSMLSDESALFLLASVAMEETTYSRKIHQWKFWR